MARGCSTGFAVYDFSLRLLRLRVIYAVLRVYTLLAGIHGLSHLLRGYTYILSLSDFASVQYDAGAEWKIRSTPHHHWLMSSPLLSLVSRYTQRCGWISAIRNKVRLARTESE